MKKLYQVFAARTVQSDVNRGPATQIVRVCLLHAVLHLRNPQSISVPLYVHDKRVVGFSDDRGNAVVLDAFAKEHTGEVRDALSEG